MHEAFFFGPEERQIFAVYHPPVGADKRVLTVICPPLFAEANRTHSILRKLAVSLAEHGQHVLRIDFSGTGDSFGDLEELTLSDWVNDISLAVQEGRDLSGCTTVRILGVRASSLLACKSATTGDNVDRLVLWDPIHDGAEYRRALAREQAAILEQHNHLSRAQRRDVLQNFRMYSLPDEMLEELLELDNSVYSSVPMDKLRVVNTSSAREHPVRGASAAIVEFPCYWETNTEGLIVAQPVLEGLSQCLTEQ